MLQADVDAVRDIMHTNIERMLDNGERLDDLIDKTTDLKVR